MQNRLLPTLFVLLAFFACKKPETATFLFHNGKIYTLAAPGQTVEAIAVQGERILFAGPEAEARKFIGDSTQIIDLQGKTLLPGFTDSHVHPVSGGLNFLECDLTGIENPDTVLARLAQYAAAHPDKDWIVGENMWLPVFPGGNAHKKFLDEIIPDRPVYVSSSDGHNAWANSKALELAGITAETPDPAKGRIERDARTKEPTGTLREEAMDLVKKLIPDYTHEQRVEALRRSLKMANSLGITNLVEASAREDYIEAYLDLAQKGELTAHVNISIYGDLSKGMDGVQPVLDLNKKYGSQATDGLRFNQVKLFMDGVVEGKTAAMHSHYAGETHSGIPNADAPTANAVIAALDKAGLQIHVHAIGDAGIGMTLDAFENARKVNGVRDARHHIAHLHVIGPGDLPRFGQLGVFANFQALWATLEDSYMTDMNFPFLGPERSEWQYPIGSVARAGGRLVFGSDWPVSTMNPFHAAQVAVTRRGPDGVEREPWTPQHLIDLQAVVEGYTKNGAFLTFREKDCGTLEAGKLADLIVLDRDIFNVSKFEIYNTQVTATMFRGKVVFEK
jgi:predicted amidohydrolase YtcJ